MASTTLSASAHVAAAAGSALQSSAVAKSSAARFVAKPAFGASLESRDLAGARLVTREAGAARNAAMSPSVARAALSQDDLKKLAAEKAVEYVKSGMVVGLGTGSTAAFAVAKIGELLKEGKLKDIVGIPTSKRTEEQALSLGIPLSVLDDHPKLDVAIDGSDEVDPDLNLVKGRGGALLREKMVEQASAKFIVIVDDTKLVDGLGGSGLAMPVEIVQFCWKYTLDRIKALPEVAGCEAKLRMEGDKPYVTDNSNYIVDLYFTTPIKDSYAAAKAIDGLQGVVDHGLFLDMATTVIIAGTDGITVKSK
ncbi:unnamed protein product [Closterium sp. Naga37s-1]|nr:unnamed protein product [Closterium sp. Naga37s-1]